MCLVNPSKHCIDQWELAFSKRLESVRKDVECFFGILKGRFRILKLPLLYREKRKIDNIFFTCCILHNMLHLIDGLENLERDVNWAGAQGLHDPEDHEPTLDAGSVGTTSPEEEQVEVESGHAQLKKKLVTSFTYRYKTGDIHWLV